MRPFGILPLIVCALCFGATNAAAQPGQFDLNYGLNGKSPLPDPGGTTFPTALMTIHDLKDIVVIGSNADNMIFAYRLPLVLNGEADSNFGVGGLAVWPEQYPGYKEIYLALAGPGQKTLAVYNEYEYNFNASEFDHTRLCMFDSKGNPELSFGDKGTLVLDLAPGKEEEYLYKGFIAPDGKIILCGLVFLNDDAQGIVICLNPDGSFDNTFNGTGIYLLPTSVGPSALATMALMPDGKIIAGGAILNSTTEQNTPILIRLNPDGTLDDQFGNSGIAILDFAKDVLAYVGDILCYPNGPILGIGAYPDDMATTVMTFKTDGSLDNAAFGGNGYVIVPLPDGGELGGLPRLANAHNRVFALSSYYVFAEATFETYPSYQLAEVYPQPFPNPEFGDDGFKEVNDLGIGTAVVTDEEGRIYVCSNDWDESLIYVSRFLGYPTIATHAPALLTELSVAPNPASEQIGLRLWLPEAENLQIALVGPDGRLCERLAPFAAYAQGEHLIRFPLKGDYAPGTYRIVVSAEDGRSAATAVSVIR